ncbi:non-ribosomal peptide synthetase [Amycolatopsis sp. TNS106]|uniref:non-ribosomal peptide synthetase n=1 Tax=Amycolatopsis sp. TNS106 TaxID=2861750 RepID=UPI001C59BEBD|nr:non-ribosomal peptide synthetase [Amycolatopsis sp. TNS106]
MTSERQVTLRWTSRTGEVRDLAIEVTASGSWSRLNEQIRSTLSSRPDKQEHPSPDWLLVCQDDRQGKPWLTIAGPLPPGMRLGSLGAWISAITIGGLRDPHAPLREVPTLTGPELAELDRWNHTEQRPRSGNRLDELVEDQVRRQPDAIAVTWPGGSMTYQDLDHRSRALADTLARHGAGPGEVVGILLPRGWQQATAALAVLYTGAAYVPLDPSWPRDRQADVLRRCESRLVVTGQAATGGEDLPAEAVPVPANAVPATPGKLPARAADDLAYVIFTSGSTGSPKGVMIDHAGAVNTILDINERFAVGPADRVLALSSLSFDLSVYDIFGTLAAGATIVCLAEDGSKDPRHWLERAASAGVTIWNSVPALLQAALGVVAEPNADLRGLRLILLSGDRIPVELPRRASSEAPRAEVISLGGATEASIWSIFHPIADGPRSATSIPYGRPLTNQQFHVLDEHLQPLPAGVPGELYIGGAGLARGYWRAPDLTAASFLEHPRYGRLYRTGDLGRRSDDGVIDFLGRRDHQVKIRGFRIELGEVETALNNLPQIREAAAVVHRNNIGEPTLVAHVVPAPLSSEQQVTSMWRHAFEQTYAAVDFTGEHPEFTGWNSAYTGEPFPVPEMEAWADTIAKIVLEEPPRRVLEIGCGTGILVRRLAAHADSYRAVDPTSAALAQVRAWLDEHPAEVVLSRHAAHELAVLPSGSADTVVINSVVQYFPTAGYLVDVLAEIIRITAAGGRIIIGDVRHRGLLRLLYADIELSHASGAEPLCDLRKRIDDRAATEHELAIDPAFFPALRRLSDRVGSIDVRPREEIGPAELHKYRYDVVISLDSVDHLGLNDTSTAFEVRLGRERALLDLVETGEDSMTVAELTAAVNTAQVAGRPPAPAPSELSQRAAWEDFTNLPRPQALERPLVRMWREILERKLPDYLIPSLFVLERELPLNDNGKVDRGRLNVPTGRRPQGAPPETADQLAVAEAWSEALDLDDFGIDDNFLELGGTSLSATVALHHLAARGYHLSPEDFFRAPTLADQAALLTKTDSDHLVVTKRTVFPLSDTQAALLAASLADPDATTYVVHSRYRVDGAVSTDDLHTAWNDLHVKHPLLGATITWDDDGRPQFDLSRPQVVPWQLADLRGLSEPRAKSAEAERLRIAWQARPLNTDEDGLAEALLIRLDDERSEILWRMHHVVLDGWSLAISERDFWQFYEARRLGHEGAIGSSPTQGRYLAWCDQRDYEVENTFWTRTLDGAQPHRFPLVADRPGGAHERLTVHIGESSIEELVQLARAHRLTITTILHGAWAVLLSRYTGSAEVVFGITSAGRPPEISGIDESVGSYVVTLPLRTTVPRSRSAAAWLSDLQEHRLRCQSHEHASPSAYSRTGQSHGAPLFDTAVITDNHPANRTRWRSGDLDIVRTSVATRTQWPLTLFLETDPRPRLVLQFDSSRVTGDQAAQISRHLAALLREVVHRPDTGLSELKMLDSHDQRPLEGHSTEPPHLPVDLQIAAQAISSPDAVAVTTSEEDMTYRRLEARVRALADDLRAYGFGPGSLIGVCLRRRADLIIALLAVLRCGGAYLPLDPDHPPTRLSLQLEDSNADAVLADATTHHLLETTRHIIDIDVPAQQSPPAPAARRSMDDTAYVVYTSGSTGHPKAVEISHSALSNALSSLHCEPGIDASDRLLAITTVAFDIAALELFLPLVAGARVVLAKPHVTRDATALAEAFHDHEITLLQATPTTWRMLIADGWMGTHRLRGWCGGEQMSPDLADALLRRTTRLWNLYGPTETTIWSLAHRVEPGDKAVPLGRPLANTRAHVMDTALSPVPRGAIGELCLEGLGLAHGYRNRPDLTRDVFVHHPHTGVRLYRTGDYVWYRPDGQLEFLGRRDEQVKFRGARIEPAEIESALRKHPRIEDSVVVVRDDRLVGYVLTPGDKPSTSAIRRFLGSTLPRAMIPSAFVFVADIPLTLNGKVDRRALPAPISRTEDRDSDDAPRTAEERLLTTVWADVLNVGHVGVHDDFFDLGGDSITALQIVIQTRRHGLTGSQRQLFDHPTVAGFASVLVRTRHDGEATRPDTGVDEPPDKDFPLAGLSATALADVLSLLDRRKGRPHG